MHWVMRRVPLWRLTCRHALETPNASPSIVHTKDGRWFISHGMGARDLKNLVPLLEKYGMQADLQPPGPDVDLKARAEPGSTASRMRLARTCFRMLCSGSCGRGRTTKCRGWKHRTPGFCGRHYGNRTKTRWTNIGLLAAVSPTFRIRNWDGRSGIRPASGWPPRRVGKWDGGRRWWARIPKRCCPRRPGGRSCPRNRSHYEREVKSALHGKPFPLQGVKILDFAWFLASAGGTRFLAAMGAESYKVEWKDNPDTRLAAMAPIGGRAARDAATGPLVGVKDLNTGRAIQ